MGAVLDACAEYPLSAGTHAQVTVLLVRATDPGTGFARTLSRRAFCHSFREDHPSELPLSAWSRDTLSQPDCPLQWRTDMDLGFLLCLDVPRSGLILCGTTFSGLLALRWQLDTHQVERQYMV